jgi:hypothetical protein
MLILVLPAQVFLKNRLKTSEGEKLIETQKNWDKESWFMKLGDFLIWLFDTETT